MTRVRWRERGKWRYGRTPDNGVRSDGRPLLVYEDRNGNHRSLRRERLQRQTAGPRGGLRWEWLP